MSNLLECHNICKTYREGSLDTQVLKGVSFALKKGELASIIGSSGSGKSTLLHILGALDDATEGHVDFLEQNLSRLSSNKQAKLRNQHLGFVYQFHHLLADFSALENVAMPLLIGGCGTTEAKSKAKALLDKVGLSHRIDHRPSELSGEKDSVWRLQEHWLITLLLSWRMSLRVTWTIPQHWLSTISCVS